MARLHSAGFAIMLCGGFVVAIFYPPHGKANGKTSPASMNEPKDVLVWAAAFMLVLAMAKAAHYLGFGGDPIIRAGLDMMGAFSAGMAVFAVLSIGGHVRPMKRLGYHVHRMSWGAMVVFVVTGAGSTLLMLWMAWDKEFIWLWLFAIIWTLVCLYGVVTVLLYEIVWDEDTIWARDPYLKWRRYRWTDLTGVDREGSKYTWNLRFAQQGRIELSDFIIGVQLVLDHAQHVLSKDTPGQGDDA
jgi:hypothetical protein